MPQRNSRNHKRMALRVSVRQQCEPNNISAARVVTLFEGNPFGPQSHWSSLLGQREYLQRELARGRRSLEQLRKDLAECGAIVEAWPTAAPARGRTTQWNRARSVVANDGMEHFLASWLEQLEKRLGAVTRDLEAFQTEQGTSPLVPEESMFELLRAAG
jgi:hypothetical protein